MLSNLKVITKVSTLTNLDLQRFCKYEKFIAYLVQAHVKI